MNSLRMRALLIVIGDAAAMLGGLASAILLARALSPAGFGIYTLALSFLSVTLLAGDAGTKLHGMTETSRDAGFDAPRFLRIRMTHLLGVLSLAALIVPLALHDPTTRAVAWSMLLYAVVDTLTADWYLRARGRFDWAAGVRAGAQILYLGGILLCVQSPDDVSRVPFLYVAAGLLAISPLYILRKIPLKSAIPLFDLRSYREAMSPALRIGIGGIVNQAGVAFSPLVVGIACGSVATGHFGVAFKLILVLLSVDRIISYLLLTELPARLSTDAAAFAEHFGAIARWTAFGGIALALTVSAGGFLLIPLLFGDEYREATTVLAVLAWFVPLTMLNTICSHGLIALGRRGDYLRTALWAAIPIGAIIALPLLPCCHSWATGILPVCEAILLGAYAHTMSRHIPIPRGLVVRIILSLVLCAATAAILPAGLSTAAASAGLILFTGWLLIDRSAYDLARRLLRRRADLAPGGAR